MNTREWIETVLPRVAERILGTRRRSGTPACEGGGHCVVVGQAFAQIAFSTLANQARLLICGINEADKIWQLSVNSQRSFLQLANGSTTLNNSN